MSNEYEHDLKYFNALPLFELRALAFEFDIADAETLSKTELVHSLCLQMVGTLVKRKK